MSSEGDHIGNDACAAELRDGDYNQGLHIASIFIIMALSFFGTMLPIIGRKVSASKLGGTPFQCLKLFGAGVILSTSLIHMFTPAQEQLTNPCLPQHFQDYSSWAGAIAILGMLFTHLIQVVAVQALRRRTNHPSAPQNGGAGTLTADPTPKELEQAQEEPHVVHRHSHAHADDAHVHSVLLSDAEKTITTYILELGIASHSIIIGLTLGVAGAEFKTLLIALSFHQFFEGLALSTIVMDADIKKRMVAIGMVLFYSFTTPVGIALGIGLNNTYNANATHALISTGVLDALSAGILLYDGLANIVFPHFQAPTFRQASTRTQGWQLVSMWLGALAMAVIGRWA